MARADAFHAPVLIVPQSHRYKYAFRSVCMYTVVYLYAQKYSIQVYITGVFYYNKPLIKPQNNKMFQ